MRDWGERGQKRGNMERGSTGLLGEAKGAAKHPTRHVMVPQQKIPQPKTQECLGGGTRLIFSLIA